MPAFTPIRHFIEALQTGETNITKRIKYLVINYSDIPPGPVKDLLDPSHPSHWNPLDPNTPKIPQKIIDLLTHDPAVCGSLSDEHKLSPDEVEHIDAMPPDDKNRVLQWVTAAKGNPAAEIWWELRRDPPTHDDVYPDPGNPLKITARTYAPNVYLGWSGFNLGSIKYK